MTRFARALGSKSSNERLPEAATSWNVMKQQLRDKLQSSESLTDSAVSSQKTWKSSDFDRDVWNKNEVKWADLEDGVCANKAAKSDDGYDKPEKKNKKKKHEIIPNEYFPQNTGDNQKKLKKKRNINSGEFNDTQYTGTELAISAGKLPHSSNTKKIKKTKKLKTGANNEVNSVSDINLKKQTVIPTNDPGDNACFANKQKTKHRQRTDSVTYEISEENGTPAEFTVDNNTKKKLGKKRKRSHDSISATHDEQATIKYGSGLKDKKKIKLEKCVASDANDHQLKKKHKYSKNKNTFQESACLNSGEQSFLEENTENIHGAVADVVPSEKNKRKKKFKGKRGDNANKSVDGSLNCGKLNFQLEGSGTRAHVNSDFVMKEEREKRTEDICHQENNIKVMKKQKFTMENKNINMGKYEKRYLQTTVLHVNGKDIEIVKFDGFPVKKEDAENLRQLKKKMIANGIPASEIKATLKLERRKAEKALAREKKKVCFHCRKSGHVLSECSELGKADTDDPMGTGICFKCGSTEHKHFECRVTREQEFRFAKCFICNEQGHIARQCPDNPRGLYPKGGACHVCGDVTHLKKDCPDLVKEKEEKIIKLQTLSNTALEALEDEKSNKSVSPKHANKKKTVKF